MATPATTGEAVTDVTMTASQRRAEIRRRKLMINSEERMNRIMGIHKPASIGAHLYKSLKQSVVGAGCVLPGLCAGIVFSCHVY